MRTIAEYISMSLCLNICGLVVKQSMIGGDGEDELAEGDSGDQPLVIAVPEIQVSRHDPGVHEC